MRKGYSQEGRRYIIFLAIYLQGLVFLFLFFFSSSFQNLGATQAGTNFFQACLALLLLFPLSFL